MNGTSKIYVLNQAFFFSILLVKIVIFQVSKILKYVTYPDSLEVIRIGKIIKVILFEERRRGDATRSRQDGDIVVLQDTAAVLLTHFRQRGPSAVAEMK